MDNLTKGRMKGWSPSKLSRRKKLVLKMKSKASAPVMKSLLDSMTRLSKNDQIGNK